MFGLLKKKSPVIIVVTLNARLQPMHRHELEDAFDAIAEREKIPAKIAGGGTLLEKNNEITNCDIEVEINNLNNSIIESVKSLFSAMLAPKGSYLTLPDGKKIPFGEHEGLGLYMNGTDLPEEVYKTCDSNFVYSECEKLIEGVGTINSHWQGPTETALYMYGKNFEEMKSRISSFVAEYPLCQKCRIERIA